MKRSREYKSGMHTIISEKAKIGKDCWIGNFVHIRPYVTIGERSEIRDHVFIGPHVTIGKNTRVYQFANIGGWATIGDNVFFGGGSITTSDKEICYPDKEGFKPDPVIVKDNVKIGFGVILLPGVVLAEGCRIGAGAVVTKSTEKGKTYVGNPAKCIS